MAEETKRQAGGLQSPTGPIMVQDFPPPPQGEMWQTGPQMITMDPLAGEIISQASPLPATSPLFDAISYEC